VSEPNVRVGVLGLQGDFDAHACALAEIGVDALDVRRPCHLGRIGALVMPGGESTTLLRLMDGEPEWWPSLARFHAQGGGFLGTCAGLILLAREVSNPPQRSLGLLDVTIERNAYGRQRDSSETEGAWRDGRTIEIVFIRAPRITRVGAGVDVLATHEGNPVLVRAGKVWGATFHPELTTDRSVHRAFLAAMEVPVRQWLSSGA
jgi:5'-phosphate synthase pdxT subunit